MALARVALAKACTAPDQPSGNAKAVGVNRQHPGVEERAPHERRHVPGVGRQDHAGGGDGPQAELGAVPGVQGEAQQELSIKLAY